MPCVGLTNTTGIPAPLLKRLEQNTHRDRDTTRDFSTTELINPTRLAFLKRTINYTEPADGIMYRLMGSVADQILDDDEGQVLTQERIKDSINSGQFDRYEADKQMLMDWKMTGYYKVKRIMEQGVWLGAKEWAIQLNDYRMKLEGIGFPVKDLFVFVMIRDTGWMAKKAGISKPWYWIPVNRISDRWISRYMAEKRNRLESAIKTGKMPKVCSVSSRWGDRRCKGYCPVVLSCPYGKKLVSK